MTASGGVQSFSERSEAVQAHLSISQNVIQRMASNSAASKGWCIAVTSAILVLVAETGHPNHALIALMPTTLFFSLDTYYLALEKRFRTAYNAFITKVHSGKLEPTDLFAIQPSGPATQAIFKAMASFAIWPFYGALLAMVVVVWLYVL